MKVSVIIPVYNTKEYLPECLDSVLGQSVRDIEILIVDDGSDDGSWEIVQQYKDLHDNILIFQQERKRQGAARNLALKNATGEFVTFLDSDDTVPSTAYQQMYMMAEENSTDMVVGIQQSFSRTRRWVGVPVHQNHFSNAIERTNIKDFPDLLSDISVCNKLIRRSKLDETGIIFPEQKSGEDLDFTARIFLEFKKISVLPEIVYNYRARENASTGRIKTTFFRDRVATTHALQESYSLGGHSGEFQFLLRSELRKLVGNRLSKVVNNLPENDREQIIDYIRSLTVFIKSEELVNSTDISPLDKIKIILLKENELDALYQFITDGNKEEFFNLIGSHQCARLVFPHWTSHKQADTSLLSRQKLKQYVRPKYYKLKRYSRKKFFSAKSIVRLLANEKSAGLTGVLKYLVLNLRFLSSKGDDGGFQDVWLIDERWAQSAEDNSLHFFIYLREKYPSIPVFYIIRKKSPQRNNVEPYGNVVILFSWEHLRLLHLAKVLISTDGFKALAFPFELMPFLRRNTFNVFLQHGVSGNKTMTYYKERYPYFDMVVTSNEQERLSFVDVYGFQESEVAVTGIARFDKLPLERKESTIRKILIAPTWRKWLANKSDISESIYYKEWSGLLKSSRFIKILEKSNIQLIFQPHFNMMKYIHDFEGRSENIQIITEPNEFLQQHIIEADLLITDYSSVMYDFFYQHKPVYSMMFDKTEWDEPPNGPPLINLESDLPLVIFENSKELIKALENAIDKGIHYEKNDLQKISRLFRYRDHNNCERIYRNIIETKANFSVSEASQKY